MNFTFETIGSNTFLVYEISEKEQIDTMTLGMLTNNNITGMSPVLFTQLNASRYLKYNVSAKISVKQFFSGSVNKKRLLGVFKSVVSAIVAAEDYMIETSSILLDTEYIFADVSSCVAEVICMPIVQEIQEKTDVKMFFKDIMFSTQFDQSENCDYVAKIINYLNSAVTFRPEDFLEVLNEISGEGKAKAVVPQVQPVSVAPQPVPVAPIQAAPVQQAPTQPAPVQQTPPPATRPSTPPPSLSKPQPQPQQAGLPPKKAPANVGFEVPGGGTVTEAPKKSKKADKKADANATTGQEKQMSMFYLLQHYNKENKAIYKAQQEEKKAAGKKGADTKPERPQATGNRPPAANQFAVPGQGPAMQQPRAMAPGQAPIAPPVTPPISAPVEQVASPAPSPVVQTPPGMNQFASGANFGETTVLGGGNIGETTVLSADLQVTVFRPYLIRVKNNEKIYMDKPVFKIGKEKSYVDYFIGDNPAISRSHADFIIRDEKVYVIDRNSTNHTYLNGQMIQSNMEVSVEHGAKVKLANEEFQVMMH